MLVNAARWCHLISSTNSATCHVVKVVVLIMVSSSRFLSATISDLMNVSFFPFTEESECFLQDPLLSSYSYMLYHSLFGQVEMKCTINLKYGGIFGVSRLITDRNSPWHNYLCTRRQNVHRNQGGNPNGQILYWITQTFVTQ